MNKFNTKFPEVPLEPHHEFILATCQKRPKTFELIHLSPRFNKKAAERARKLSNSHRKPMIILNIVPDSFSRRHFYRKMPLTIQYLNTLKSKSNWRVYDFQFHNIIGTDTMENQSRVFGTSAPSREIEGN